MAKNTKCIYCGHNATKNLETRSPRTKEYVYRRKLCMDCGRTFSTVEISMQRYKQLISIDEASNNNKEIGYWTDDEINEI